jgi:ribose transport system substrate-binding protein
MKKTALVILAAASLALSTGMASAAAKKQLVIIVKGLDNPYFESMHKGCESWNSKNPNSQYTCYYTGPASTADEAGEAQILQDMLAKPTTAAIAISPSDAHLIANILKNAKPKIPIMTVDADLAKADKALRKTYLGTDNYQMGVDLAKALKAAEPKGGTVCLIEGGAAADNILRRAQGTYDVLSGQKGLKTLTGQGGWTEVKGCPVFTNDDGAKGVQAMTDILSANPKLTAFVLEGGWPLFAAPEAYKQLITPLKAKLADGSFYIASADTIGAEPDLLKAGLVNVLVGQQPFQMGLMAPDVMIKLIDGKKVSDPVYTGLDHCTQKNVSSCISGATS